MVLSKYLIIFPYADTFFFFFFENQNIVTLLMKKKISHGRLQECHGGEIKHPPSKPKNL